MNTLDNLKRMRQLDKSGMWQSIESLGLQCKQAWEEVKQVKIPKNYRQVDNILINGMGGSALGGHIIGTLYNKELRLPLKVINDYVLPEYVNQRTLYIVSSYSGDTEEPLSTVLEARRRKAKLLVIGSGGKLAKLASRFKIPGYFFTPNFNPCGQPRMGLGYSIFGQLALFKKAGLIKTTGKVLDMTIEKIVSFHRQFGLKVPQKKNQAKKVAYDLRGRIPIIVGAEHLIGNAHAIANQLNENSKTFATYFVIPELNHHLMEGLLFPKTNIKNLYFVFLKSDLYYPRVQTRFAVSKKVLNKNKIPHLTYSAKSKQRITQVFEVLLFGSYVNYYLAILNGLDPSPVPYVDYFKAQLEKIK